MQWIDNESLFVAEAAKGHAIEERVAHRFESLGFVVERIAPTIRDNVSQIASYANTVDMAVEGLRFEVKSRALAFTGPSDFPYDPVFVDTADGWLKKSPMPSVVLCVSQVTGFGMWLPVRSSAAAWVVRQTRDRVRDITDTFYAAPLACWARVPDLLRILSNRRMARESRE